MSLSTGLSVTRAATRHQAVMIDPVEEFFEIKVNYDAVARGNVLLRLGYCLMGERPGRNP